MDNNEVNITRVAKNTIFLYVRMLLVMFISLLTTRKLLTALGVEDYGLYNVVCGFVTMFSFLNTSMANGTQRFYNYEIGKNGEQAIGKVYTHAIIIHCIIAIIIFFIVELFGLWYLYNKMVIPDGRFEAAFWILQLSLLQLIITVITVPYSAAVMAYEKMNFYAFVGVLDAIIKLVIVYLLSIAPIDKLIFYGVLMSLITVINFLLNYLYCKKNFFYLTITKGFDKNYFRRMITFSGWNIFGAGAHMVENQGINLIFNAFWGTILNAANGIASQVSAAVRSLVSGFITAIRPQMIKSYACGNITAFSKMYYSSSKLAFFLVMILAVPMIGEIDTILNLWLGKGKYPEITTIFCQLTMIIALCNSYATPSSIIVHATGNMKKFQIIVSLVILTIIPIGILVARLGGKAYYILIISACLNIIVQIVRLFLIKEQVGFSVTEYVKKVFIPTWLVFIVSLTLSLSINFFMPQGLSFSIISIILNILLSLLTIYYLGITQEEKTLIRSIFKFNKK